MSLIPYYLQYVSEICEGTRKAPAGIVLTEQEDLKKALQLQAEITKLGIPAFVKACAEADGTEIPQEEYDSFDPAELNTAIAQLAAASQPQEPAEEAPQEPVRTETRDIFEIFLDSVCLDDALLTYLIDILKRRSEPEFSKLSHAAARTELKLDEAALGTILEAGIAEFARCGFQPASVASVAKNAGVSVGVIYKYFGDKDAFFLACVRHSLELLDATLQEAAAGGGPLEVRMQRLILALIRQSRSHAS